MKTWKIFTAAAAAAVIFTAAVPAETFNTIEQVEETALLNNLEYKTAVLEVLKAENELESLIKLDSSSISLSASLNDPEWQTSVSLPVFDRLSLGAAVDQDLNSTLSLSFNPLSHSTTAEQSKLNYKLKLAAAEDKAQEIADTAVESYLAWAAASSDYQVELEEADIKKLLYEDEKIRFDKGESDLDAVREAFAEWSDSRTSLNTSLNKLQTAEAELYNTLNIDPADHEIISPAEADLFNLTGELQSAIESAVISTAGSYRILEAGNTVENLQLELDGTWLFEPQLNINGGMIISPDTGPQFTAAASLSFGFDDWNADEREELSTELEISRQRAVQTMYTEQLSLQQAVTAAETAAINYEVAEVELEQAEELLDEAEFLYELGEYSEAEYKETAIIYQQSKNNLFSAAADHYTALRALAVYAE